MKDWEKVFESWDLPTATMVMGILMEHDVPAKTLDKKDFNPLIEFMKPLGFGQITGIDLSVHKEPSGAAMSKLDRAGQVW